MSEFIYTKLTPHNHCLQPEEWMVCKKCNQHLQAWILQNFELCCFCGNESPYFYRMEDLEKGGRFVDDKWQQSHISTEKRYFKSQPLKL